LSHLPHWIIDDLTDLRKSRGITRSELARAIGVIEGTILKWENNETDPAFRSVVRMAEFLGLEFDLHPIEKKRFRTHV
jgi:transcriptional regulator with XRE-family HTH domain